MACSESNGGDKWNLYQVTQDTLFWRRSPARYGFASGTTSPDATLSLAPGTAFPGTTLPGTTSPQARPSLYHSLGRAQVKVKQDCK